EPASDAGFADAHKADEGDGAVAQRCIAIHERPRLTRARALAPTSGARYDPRMSRLAYLIAVLFVAGAGSAVRAQAPGGLTGQIVAQPQGVEVTALAPPD